MNKTYIKRQLTLSKLGFPMDKEVQEYIKCFRKLIGSPSKLTKTYISNNNQKGYMYKNDTKKLFFQYNSIKEGHESFLIDNNNITFKFVFEFTISYPHLRILLMALLEHSFNCKIYNISFHNL